MKKLSSIHGSAPSQLSQHANGDPASSDRQHPLLTPPSVLREVNHPPEPGACEASDWWQSILDSPAPVDGFLSECVFDSARDASVIAWASQFLYQLSEGAGLAGDQKTADRFEDLERVLQWLEYPLDEPSQRQFVQQCFDWYADFLHQPSDSRYRPCQALKTGMYQLWQLLLVVDEINKTRVPLGEEMSLALVEELARDRM